MISVEEEAAMCREYRERLVARLPSDWTVTYVGLVDRLKGGASKHGLKPGCLCVKASIRSKLFAEGLSICIGIGMPEGKKMDPSTVVDLLNGAMRHAEAQRAEMRKKLGGR